jgi:quinolinate synthase
LGERILVLGHHYQRDEVIKFSDFRGDSLKLARIAAEQGEREFIIFCGVHFMAETADILSQEHQKVILPDLSAGCSMADMADRTRVQMVWEDLSNLLGPDEVTPITYINSSADLKAFCGQEGGIVCTSSNASQVLRWGLAQRGKVLFFPDQHLGRNTARKMGFKDEEIILWNPEEDLGGNSEEAIQRSRIILWYGFCSVHQVFLPQHVIQFRERYPGIKVIAHPECRQEVVDLADLSGSTEFIIQTVKAAPSGSRWAIGTELNLVNRLKNECPDKEVFFLSPTVCMCSTMYRIDPPHLLWSMESLLEGQVVNQIRVAEPLKEWAKLALERMLSVS